MEDTNSYQKNTSFSRLINLIKNGKIPIKILPIIRTRLQIYIDDEDTKETDVLMTILLVNMINKLK